MRKAKQAGALYGGREPSLPDRKALRSRVFWIVRSKGWKDERASWKGRCFSGRFGGGRAWEARKPKGAEVLTGVNRFGRMKGTRLSWGEQTAEATGRGREVSSGIARAEREVRKGLKRSPGKRKASKGEAHERGGLKEVLKGERT